MSKSVLQNFVTRIGAHEPIFAEGDSGTTMFIVHSGKVRLYRTVDGEQRDLGVMEKGDFFGEMSVLEGCPRSTSAEALDPSELIEINSTTFDKMIRGNIEIAIRLLRKVSLRLREAEQRNVQLLSGGARAVTSGPSSVSRPQPAKNSVADGLRLEVHGEERNYALNEQESLIGRFDPVTEMKPDVDLTDVDLKRSVSRRHARIVRVDDGYTVIEEIGALNGTFVNDTQLVTGQAHPLVDGDELSVGMVKLRFRV